MTWIADLQDAIAAEASFSLTVGTDLFAGRRSDDAGLPDRMLLLTEWEGDVLEHFGVDSDEERPNLQILARGSVDEYEEAHDLAWEVWRWLCRILDTTYGSTHFVAVRPLNARTPNALGQDSSSRFRFTADFKVHLGASS